jgi:hypothetical protein
VPETSTEPIDELADIAAAVAAETMDHHPTPDQLRPVVEAILAEHVTQEWTSKQLAEMGIRSMEIRDGAIDLDMKPAAEATAMWVGIARTMLGDAPNYTETAFDGPAPERDHEGLLEMRVGVPELPERYTFTLQRVGFGKLTPHEARQRAEAERDDVLRMVAQWCTETANGPQNAPARDAAADLAFRLEQAGHTLPEVI